jgi:hypothetical protein
MKYTIDLPGGQVTGTLNHLEMKRFEFGLDENGQPLECKAVFEPERQFDCGAGKGHRLETKLHGGVVGIVLDGRGRPFDLSTLSEDQRVSHLRAWMTELDIYPTDRLQD